eukprot:TRINITY_DN6920_c0_g1_i6.p1 TRINITY_DN6920_c0_g1~~TRINITY_DN6920_c0_g1_i6.p1  ORF type:complete len:850 (+),score=168.95 TRINITY_DN6920_c0_g1_i6:387-2936(+)
MQMAQVSPDVEPAESVNRMNGKRVLWVPGTDHAGIATQSVVERRLWNESKQTKYDLGREAFQAQVWEWKVKYGNRIYEQLKRLGSSLDWSREHFTMDETLTKAVVEGFVRFHDAGLIYRDNRLVNWSCGLQTAISDIECDDWVLEGPSKRKVPGHPEDKQYEFGWLWSFAYKVEDSDEEVVVATTRPETMLGDTAVAVHPDHDRYKGLHGKYLVHPFVSRRIPIVTDAKLVKMDFGTGAVKVTPAHDPNDYECGKRNNLAFINIFNKDGSMNENTGPFVGMMRFEARIAVLKQLSEKGLYRGKEKNPMTLKICSRSSDVIEPFMAPQWWVKMDDLAKRSVEVVESGELKILPPSRITWWNDFLTNIRPWCISRQLWWGHRIPAYLAWENSQPQPRGDLTEDWIIARDLEEAKEKATKKFGNQNFSLKQDDDVLDTWFSSGLFPFSVMGWPDNTSDMEKYYPTQLLETGHDILFFWVARMVMMGLQLTGKLPFTEVLLHAIVRDKNGEKMSKATGNVIDPLNVIEGVTLEELHETLYSGNLRKDKLEEAIYRQKKDFPNGISECGTDALRFALCSYTSQGKDINLDILRVEGYRNFCNKLWQATKLSLTFLGPSYCPRPNNEMDGREYIYSKWILSKLDKCIVEVSNGFVEYDFAKATSALYSFWMYSFCDVYLEVSKTVMFVGNGEVPDAEKQENVRATIHTCLDVTFKMLHPFMPFLTEELWQRLPRQEHEKAVSICVSQYPQSVPARVNIEVEEKIQFVQDIVHTIRACCATHGIVKKKVLFVSIHVSSEKTQEFLKLLSKEIIALAYLKGLDFTTDTVPPPGCAVEVVADCTLFLPVGNTDTTKVG